MKTYGNHLLHFPFTSPSIRHRARMTSRGLIAWRKRGLTAARALAPAASLSAAGCAGPCARAGTRTVVAALPGPQPGRHHTRPCSVFASRHSGHIGPRRSASAANGIGGKSSSACTLIGAAANVKFEMAGGDASGISRQYHRRSPQPVAAPDPPAAPLPTPAPPKDRLPRRDGDSPEGLRCVTPKPHRIRTVCTPYPHRR